VNIQRIFWGKPSVQGNVFRLGLFLANDYNFTFVVTDQSNVEVKLLVRSSSVIEINALCSNRFSLLPLYVCS